MQEPIIGIDLGTTNSEVAIVKNNKVIVIETNGKKILPSVVGLSSDGAILVGETAKNQYVLYPERTILSIKRRMGQQEKVSLGNKEYSPQEISAIILKQLKLAAETYLQEPVKKAVITVPAYFSDAQRQATREAGELSGLEVVRIINEPTAAALAYGAANQNKKTILVYDLGGGTFDVSIVSLQSNVIEVLASTGNNHLGGDDFDATIINFIEDHLNTRKIDISQHPQAKARIRRAAEAAKITLSDHPFALIEEEYLLEAQEPVHLSLELSRDAYEEMIMSYIDETLNAVHKALEQAGLMSSEIDEVLLVGGSTRTPIIAEKLTEIFQTPPRAEVDPELCVAMGAAIQAGIISGEACSAVLVDVTPYTFGTSYFGMLDDHPCPHVYKPIIQKNTPIPVTKSEVFYTMYDEQEAIEVHVFQGEDPDASENIEIGEFKVEGLSKAAAGNPIIINFKLDLDGILQVTAKEKRTGLERKLIINNAISQFTAQEMVDAKQRIEQLFETTSPTASPIHSRALELVKKAEGLLHTLSSEDKEDAINLIEDIKDAIYVYNETKLTAHTEKLSDMLFYLEANVT